MWQTFDVGGIVDALSESNARVAAGAGGMARSVRQAKMAATPDQLWEAKADELVVITAETVLAGHSSSADLVQHLCDSGVGALAVRLGSDKPLPAELLESADERGFPLITFPGKTPLHEVTTTVLNALLDAQAKRLARVLEIHQAFTPVVLAAGGMHEIATLLFDLLGFPVAIIDQDLEPLAAVPSDPAERSPAAIGDDRDSVVRHPIIAGHQHYGEIVVDTAGAPLNNDQHIALERASMAIAIRLAHAQAAATELEQFAAMTLEELISGRAGDAAGVAERAMTFGWDLNRSRAVLLASIDPVTRSAAAPHSLSAMAAAARATLGSDAIVWTRSSSIAALIAPGTDRANEVEAAPGTDDLVERRHLAEALRSQLDRTVTEVTISVGVGRSVADPLQLPRSYLEASRAVDVGRWVKGRHATEVYDDLGLERLLASAAPDDLAEFVGHAIGPLLDHDREHGTDLVGTLRTWLETHNMAESARRLFVHYNTLKNRIDKIEAILGPILDDPQRSLECQVAIHVHHHYDGPWTADPIDAPPESAARL